MQSSKGEPTRGSGFADRISASLLNRSEDRIYSLDAARFFASLTIVYYHIFHQNIIPYVNNSHIYTALQRRSSMAGILVEFFLIISGYFLFKTEKNKKPFLETALDRFVRLWPVFAFYIVIMLSFYKMKPADALSQLAFLHCTGLTSKYAGIIWYIAPAFWASLLVATINRSLRPNSGKLLLAVLLYFGYAININMFDGNLGRETVLGFLSAGFLPACAWGFSLLVLRSGSTLCFGLKQGVCTVFCFGPFLRSSPL